MRSSFIWIGLVLGGLAAGPSWAGDAADAKVHQDIHRLKKDYQRKVDKELKALGARIRRLERQGTRAEDRVRADINKEVGKLRAKKADADRKLAELGRSAGDAWQDLRQGVDDAVSDLKKAVDEAAERFRARE